MRFLGVDYGLKKIGLAVGDDETGLAFPHVVIPAGEDAPQRLKAIAKEQGIDAFVAGIPIPTEAHYSEEQLNLTLAFVSSLKAATKLPVHLVDEQFSSAEARRMQKEYGVKAPEDAVAAMIILQAYLDEKRINTD